MSILVSSILTGYITVAALIFLYLLSVYKLATANLSPVASFFYVVTSLFFSFLWFPTFVVLMVNMENANL